MFNAAGLDGVAYGRFVLALAAVLALVFVAGWVLRRLVAGGALPGGLLAGTPGRVPRLAVVEVRAVDVRRRLVLIRRDGVEHLLLLGPAEALVIETGIVAPPTPAPGGPPSGTTPS